MPENAPSLEATRDMDVRALSPVLKTKEQVDKIRDINGISISGRHNKGSSGWLLHGLTPQGWEATVKLGTNPVKGTGYHYEQNAQLLKEASSRTIFVPLYFGHGETSLPDQTEKFPYIAMEHIKGRMLRDVIKDKYTPIQTSLDILKTVARGVDELVPIISTDLSPRNIMIREQNDRPVLIDFDLAKKEGLVMRANQPGTPAYGGPELVKGGKLTRELNTWQLGAIAFEMLTHERFMNMENPNALTYRYLFEDKYNEFLEQRLNEVGLPTATRDVLARALSYQPEKRFHTATDFANELDKAERDYIQTSGGRHEGHTIKRSVTRRRDLGAGRAEGGHRPQDRRDDAHPAKPIGRHAAGRPKHRREGSSK